MWVRDNFRRNVFVSVVACVWMVGCHDYKWQWSFQSPEDMQRIEEQARQQQKLVFIFYKWYLDSDANRMHGDVLADNEVGALFSDTVNLLIDKAAGPNYERYLTKYGVTAPPACILIAPDGRYKVLTGYVPKERFIELVKAARRELLDNQQRPAPSKVVP
ncbi:MAG TPA: hypothetical protein PL151_17045 [Phycisphaerae bacterium]|nr:hypothetical protein [Phycisphaerae bacterium]HOJ74966.1 hypothetical protein [Phycisphaerae bacterium]HOM51527.1 hypothetical protein [Phycisphaerae bacterium]HON67298.1 hypothetical protein [Phycisphaerae bacterium]HOQ87072.1 hypothetical protein [Phycisphaerae bacterium]